MHGLIFETSIWLLAGSTRYPSCNGETPLETPFARKGESKRAILPLYLHRYKDRPSTDKNFPLRSLKHVPHSCTISHTGNKVRQGTKRQTTASKTLQTPHRRADPRKRCRLLPLNGRWTHRGPLDRKGRARIVKLHLSFLSLSFFFPLFHLCFCDTFWVTATLRVLFLQEHTIETWA